MNRPHRPETRKSLVHVSKILSRMNQGKNGTPTQRVGSDRGAHQDIDVLMSAASTKRLSLALFTRDFDRQMRITIHKRRERTFRFGLNLDLFKSSENFFPQDAQLQLS
jgi:hypothetical protein